MRLDSHDKTSTDHRAKIANGEGSCRPPEVFPVWTTIFAIGREAHAERRIKPRFIVILVVMRRGAAQRKDVTQWFDQ